MYLAMYAPALKTTPESQKMSSVHVALLWLSSVSQCHITYKNRHMCVGGVGVGVGGGGCL